MNIRDKLQTEWAKELLKVTKSLLHICPRGGKISTSIKFFRLFEEE